MIFLINSDISHLIYIYIYIYMFCHDSANQQSREKMTDEIIITLIPAPGPFYAISVSTMIGVLMMPSLPSSVVLYGLTIPGL